MLPSSGLCLEDGSIPAFLPIGHLLLNEGDHLLSTASSTDDKTHRRTFRRLHESGCFVMPNPWDVGTARYLRSLGFQALATTSSGFAFSRGLPDTDWAVPRDMMLAHIAEIVAAADLPVNADFESGYAHEPEAVAANVRLCVETGVAGLSIEDATGDKAKPLYELPLAVERIRAARAAIDASGTGVLLTARAECFLVGHPDPLKESIRRLEAYAEAGADVLYAPDLGSMDEIRAVVAAVAPKPVNVLISSDMGLRVADLAEAGVRRISVGSALARAAWGGFMRTAETIAREGSFAGFAQNRPFTEINTFFREDVEKRHKGANRL
jgi:2-methylisocitrate lyase-like PEP mutase family enzyme